MAALLFLVKTAFDLISLVFILRFILHAVRADFHNPLSQFVYRVTNGLVSPLRRVVPNVGGFELATLLLIVVIQGVGLLCAFALRGIAIPLGPLLVGSVLGALLAVLRFLTFALIVNAILSWAPGMHGHPLARILDQICAPVLRPIRSILPLIAGLDLSPLVAIILLQAVSIQLAQLPYAM